MHRVLALVAVILVVPSAAIVAAVSHAAGRMGVSVVGQLREKWSVNDPDKGDQLEIHAIVKTEEEANRLRLDLCGGVLREGKLMPLLDLKADLGVKLFVVPDDANEAAGLSSAFAGAEVAVLLSAAHADFKPERVTDAELAESQLDASDEVLPRTAFHARASSAYKATKAAAQSSGISVRVPPVMGASAARRLGAEVSCVTSAGSTTRHVLLRSSLGTESLMTATAMTTAASQEDLSQEAMEELKEERALASMAISRMGGASAIAAQADAEDMLRTRCDQREISYTILRLGALVDSAGGVPLAFGCRDAQLLETLEGDRQGSREPPLISRNDAARLVADIVSSGLADGFLDLAWTTVDVAWEARGGMSSAGTEEAARMAARQDLVVDAVMAAKKGERAA